MDQRTGLIKLALFGRPVKDSLSPAIHREFADQLGLDIEYRAIETGPGEFPQALQAFLDDGGRGCNVTLPLKGDAWRLAATSSQQAEQAQAANTLHWQSSGWFAHTTDGIGLMEDLRSNHGIAIDGKRILVLGAGGAVAGILGGLLAAGPDQVVLVNRDQGRAQALARRFGLAGKNSVIAWKDLPGAGCFDLVINATSLGHQGLLPPLDIPVFAPDAVCYDLNYHHASKPLKAWCEANDQRYIDGLG
ncbi:MAG: shikimate dehydrogenase, partial [Xanthomonadales bacterium]|nr:shikimate dehydrogenase [Xanthomonadales bacterium]